MLYFIVSFLVIANGLANADDCSKSVLDVCKTPFYGQDMSEIFPETRRQLHSFCSEMEEYLDCAIPFEEKCDKEASISSKTIDLLAEICDEDTLLYAAIVQNLKCLKTVLTDEKATCIAPDSETLRKSGAYLLELGLNPRSRNQEEDELDNSCLFDLHVVACLDMEILHQCGEVALNAYLDIQRKINYVDSDCEDNYGKLLTAMIRLQRLENKVEEEIKRRK